MLRFVTALARPRALAPPSVLTCRSTMSGSFKQISPKFVPLEAKEANKKSFRFRLISYNILAQVYVKSSYFPHSPSSCLKWKARSRAILAALEGFNADFLCIQELDEYDSFYKSNMEVHGYSSIYIQRNGQKRDGCGIFYKPRSAELVLTEDIYYNDLVDSLHLESKKTPTGEFSEQDNHDDDEASDDPHVRLKRDCVGLLAAFRLNDPSHHLIIVANTHIYWDPEWVDVKLAQVKYLLLRLGLFKEAVSDRFNCRPSVIVAGDFNSTPGDEVYNHLTLAKASTDGSGIQLCSLYASNGGEPPYTNCTPGFTGTLDYIFLSSTIFLKPVSLLQIPGPESPEILGGLPNHHHPSDHLPIGGDFAVCSHSDSILTSIPCEEVRADLLRLKLNMDTSD